MAAILVWGKGFELRSTTLSSGDPYEEVFGIDGGSDSISWSSVGEFRMVAASHGVAEDAWPIYPDCDVDRDIPIEHAERLSRELLPKLEAMGDAAIRGNRWLTIIVELLRGGNAILIVP